MTRLPVRVAAAALGFCLTGCAMTFDSTHLGVPVTMAADARTPAAGTPFQVTKHPLFIGWGLFTLGTPRLEDVLAGQVGVGSGVADLRIKMRARWSDLLITGLTAGLVSPRSVTFEGVVVGPTP